MKFHDLLHAQFYLEKICLAKLDLTPIEIV